MHEPWENDRYFTWLCEKIASKRDFNRFSRLLYSLYKKEFFAKLASDENRIGDVATLRESYEDYAGYDSSDIPTYEASVLELMITISERMTIIMGDRNDNSHWFWDILNNLMDENYENFDNNALKNDEFLSDVDIILDNFVNRRYDYYGFGGLFPLTDPIRDQRKVEIWYQMQSYLNEIYPD